MYYKSKQGEIDITGTVLLENITDSTISIVNLIRVSNPAAYVFTLSRYSAADATLIQVYTFNLSAGDVFTDEFTYYLDTGDYLIGYSDVVGTNYVTTVFDANR